MAEQINQQYFSDDAGDFKEKLLLSVDPAHKAQLLVSCDTCPDACDAKINVSLNKKTSSESRSYCMAGEDAGGCCSTSVDSNGRETAIENCCRKVPGKPETAEDELVRITISN